MRTIAAPITRNVATKVVPTSSKRLKARAAPKYWEIAPQINKNSGGAEDANSLLIILDLSKLTR